MIMKRMELEHLIIKLFNNNKDPSLVIEIYKRNLLKADTGKDYR